MKAAPVTSIPSVTRHKTRSSTKIAVGFVLTLGALYFGAGYYSAYRVGGLRFKHLKPGMVNIVGLAPGAGYRVIVSNQMAQLVESATDFNGQQSDAGGPESGSVKKRLPIREMLQSLQGNERALSDFVMSVNDIKTDGLPARPVFWTAAELRRAIDGDKTLQAKLATDLNVNLDGTPLPQISKNALWDGIVIKAPVSVQVDVEGTATKMIATVLLPYRPALLASVEAKLMEKKVDISDDTIRGYYLQESRIVQQDPVRREDVAKSLLARIDPATLQDFAVAPERILRSATVVVNENFITSASYKSYDSTKGQLTDMSIELTGEGRDRLWQFSRRKDMKQLLLIVNGIAIAAPTIGHELAQRDLVVTQMPDLVLVKDAVDSINQNHQRANK